MINYSAIIVAAGSGKRLQLPYNKVLFPLDKQTIIQHSAKHFIADNHCKQIIIVIKSEEQTQFEKLFKSPKVIFCEGGKERYHSVKNALVYVNQSYVMVHDGARPFVSMDEINHLKEALLNCDGVILSLPVTNTIKVVTDDNIVETTLVRKQLRAIITPQAFKTDILKKAYQQLKNTQVTDDAQVVELANIATIHCIEGNPHNIKITHPSDLQYAINKVHF